MIRSMAYAGMNKPPRLINIPQAALDMYEEAKKSPNWNQKTFEDIGLGGKMGGVLFTWVNCLIDVCFRQQEFLAFITEPFPQWLEPLMKAQRKMRGKEMELVEIRKEYVEELLLFIIRIQRNKIKSNYLNFR